MVAQVFCGALPSFIQMNKKLEPTDPSIDDDLAIFDLWKVVETWDRSVLHTVQYWEECLEEMHPS